MVQFTYRFDNIMSVREQEKQQTEAANKESVRLFEEIATTLYELLKKKEDLITYQNDRLAVGATIDAIHHFATFINSLEQTIAEVQQKVVQARTKMNYHEQKLLEKNLEIRKFEKMREKDLATFKSEQDKAEMLYMDELSSLMYYRKEFR